MIGGRPPHIGRIDAVRHVEQAATGGLLDESPEDIVNNLFEISEKAFDRVSRRRSIEPTAQLNDRVPKLSCNRSNAVYVLIVAVKKTVHQRGWLVVSCSPHLRQGEHVEFFEKLEREMLKQRQRLCLHDIEERLYRMIILQGR